MITHISHTLAQQIVNTIKDVCSYDINFINSSGTIIASTNSARIGAFHEIGRKAAVTGTTIEVAESDNFTGTRQGINMPLYHEDRLLAVIGITGSPEKVRKYAFLAQRITSLLIREQELGQYSRHQADKKQFVISSLLHGDTQNPEYLLKCLREFQIDPDTPKRLILIHTYPAASGQNYTDSVSGSVLSEHQIQNFFKTAGITLYTFRYPGDYLAVTDSSGFSALSGTLRDFAKKHAGTLAVAVGRSVPLYQLGLSLEAQAKEAGVEIRCNTEVTPEYAEKENADVMILAVGSNPIVPPLKGIDGDNVVIVNNYYLEKEKVGDSVVVLGGGLAGCEAAIHLAQEGKKVHLVEMRPELAPDANIRHRPILMQMVEKYVEAHTGYQGLEVTSEGVICKDPEGKEVLVPGKSVICAVGQRANRAAVDQLRDCAPVVREIGDCVRPSNITSAIYMGYHAGLDA